MTRSYTKGGDIGAGASIPTRWPLRFHLYIRTYVREVIESVNTPTADMIETILSSNKYHRHLTRQHNPVLGEGSFGQVVFLEMDFST